MKKEYIVFGVICVVFIAIFIFSGKSEKKKVVSDQKPGKVAAVEKKKTIVPKKENPKIFQIIKKECRLPFKCSLDIRLKERVSEEKLKELALKIKRALKENERKAGKIFISYYLPEMAIDAGHWAYSNFTPSLDLGIQGITKKEEKKLIADPKPVGKIIGKWFHNQLKMKCTIVKRKNRYYFISVFSDGSKGEEELLVKKVQGKKRYYEKDGDPGEYYMINSKGVLETYDSEGLIDTYTFSVIK